MAEKQKTGRRLRTQVKTAKTLILKGDLAAMRAMPESISAEAAVLGSMIIDPQCIGFVIENVDRNAFYRFENQEIFDALSKSFREK